jgi:manganese/iron transport system ATP-binding protein/manganese/zinc/iron transport system ATP- binding protein
VSAAAIVVHGLAAGYTPGEIVIDGLDFEVPVGSTVAVLGPNGGGKTTLFKALLGELPERRGEIEVAEPVAYVPQTERYRLDFPVSALDVVLMGTYAEARWYRPLGRERRAAALEALARVGLPGLAGERFGSLSGGQRQRALIARAIVRDARVLLLDEPLSGVDRPAADRVLALLAELRDDDRTILVSSHDIEQARRFDSVLCVNGRQVFHGPPDRMTAAIIRDTYGGEIVELDGGSRAIVVQHHPHD